MALPSRILVHTATPLEYDESPAPVEFIEGEPGAQGGGEPTLGVPFPCVLFLPGAGGEQPNAYRSRVVRTPTVLFNPTRANGSSVTLDRDSELMISAPELAQWTNGDPSRWQVVGVAQPFGPPGQVIGVQASLRQVED